MIELLKDKQYLKTLWYHYSDILGPLYTEYLNDMIDNDYVYCYKINNIPVAVIGYSIKDRKQEVQIDFIITSKEHQDEGIGTLLMKHIYEVTKGFYLNLGYSLTAKLPDLAGANIFFNNLSIAKTESVTKKQNKYIKYYLDLHKLMVM